MSVHFKAATHNVLCKLRRKPGYYFGRVPILYFLNYLARLVSLAGHMSVHFEAGPHNVLCKLRHKPGYYLAGYQYYIY